jgi:predicted Zn-ribbon and HTH transcriptional regulator
MRTSKELGTTAIFIEDTEEGGVLLLCDNCGYEFVDLSLNAQACVCPHCDTELFYRPWFEW